MHRFSLLASALVLASTCVSITGCMNAETDGAGESDKTPLTSGVLMVSLAGTERSYSLRQDDGSFVRLDLGQLQQTKGDDAAEGIDWTDASGTPVDVFGAKEADGSITVEGLRPSESLSASAGAVVTTGAMRVLALNVNFDNKGALGTNKDLENLMGAVSGHYAGSSFGKVNLGYDVAGPFNVTFGTCDDLWRWLKDAQNAAVTAGKTLTDYTHFAVFGKLNCGYAGLGQVGGNITFLAGLSPAATIHELGHNFGLAHAHSRACKNSSGVAVPMSDSCTVSEYGDPFDTMGAGWGRQFSASYKASLGWIPAENVKFVPTSQTVTIAPASRQVSGTQVLNLEGPGDFMYQVEFRQPAPTDTFPTTESDANGVLVRAISLDPNLSGHSYLLDMNPGGDFKDAALGVGKSYTLFGTTAKLTVESVSSTGAKVQVSGLSLDTTPTDSTSDSLVASHSGKCVSVKTSSLANGAYASQRSCSAAADQQWKFQSVATDTFTIKNVNSGKCLAVVGASLDSKARVDQETCQNVPQQQWKQKKLASGNIVLSSVNSGKCLTLYSGSTAEGAMYVQWTCHDWPYQQFRRQ